MGAEAVARAFVAARKAGTGLPDYPGEVPATLDHAYRIQARAIDLFGGEIAGWKIGRIPEPLDAHYGANRLVGPIFADSVAEANGSAPEMPVFGQGFAAAEAEFLLRIGRLPDPGRDRWTNAEAAAHIDEIRVGLEIASSPFPGINTLGPAVTVSDFGNNKGLVLGEVIDGDSGFLDWLVMLRIDGEEAGRGTAAAMLDGPYGSARFLFELAAARGLPLAVGQWISTGAVTGVHPVRPGAQIEARFGERLRVACRITG
jgi:2-keto-4-pentenoate hydratase